MIVEMEQNPLKAAVQLSLGGLAVDEDIDIDESAVDLLGLPETAARRENLSNAGRGRPRGARNHTTQYWVDYIRRRYCSPLEVLAQLATSPIDVLAREASCSRLDAIIQKRHAAELPTCYADPGARGEGVDVGHSPSRHSFPPSPQTSSAHASASALLTIPVSNK